MSQQFDVVCLGGAVPRRLLSQGKKAARVVLEPGLCVYRIYNGYWFFGRPTVEELRLDLRAVLQRCRPDWDIGRTEQRTAWVNGDKAAFYPYGKRRHRCSGLDTKGARMSTIHLHQTTTSTPELENTVKTIEARNGAPSKRAVS